MQELARSLETIARTDAGLLPDGDEPVGDWIEQRQQLRKAARDFAGFAIESLNDDARYLALKVCDDLAAFLNYWDKPKAE